MSRWHVAVDGARSDLSGALRRVSAAAGARLGPRDPVTVAGAGTAVTPRRGRVLVCAFGYAPRPPGGAERQAQLQAEEMSRRGLDVTVVCPRVPGTRSGVINGVTVVRLRFVDRRPLGKATYLLALQVFLLARLRSFDRVFVHLAFLQADVAVLAGTLLRRPVWVRPAASGRLGEISRMRRIAMLTRYAGLRHARHVQAVSAPIADELRSIGVASERILRIPNGVDTSSFGPASPGQRDRARARLELPSGRVVLFVGRLARHKGLATLLEAWASLRPAGASLVLLGSPDTFDPAPRAVHAGVIWRGWTAAVRDYYRAADVFVLPSLVEGMSNALLEAMSCGLAVCATRVAAAEDMIVDDESGLLVPPGDAGALAAALGTLLGDQGLRERLGSAAAATVRRRFAIEAVVDRILGRAGVGRPGGPAR